MSVTISVEPLTAEAFAPFGAVIEANGDPSFMINAGRCGRYHDLARPESAMGNGATTMSVAKSEAISLPMTVGLMERHPAGSQAFIPMDGSRMVVIVAEDNKGTPGTPRAFLSDGNQGIQYRPNCWHGVLSPLTGPSNFLIVDWVGVGENLEEFPLSDPFIVE